MAGNHQRGSRKGAAARAAGATPARGVRAARRGTPASSRQDHSSAISAYHEEVLVQNEQLKETQQELENSRDRFARLYDEAPVGYVTLDRNGVVERVNATALNLLGTVRTSMLGRPLLVFVHEDDRSAFLNFLLFCRANAAQKKQWVEVRLRLPEGRFAHVQISSVGVSRDSGNGMVYLAALTDVTGRVLLERERRKAEERVAEATRQRSAAQAASEAKDRFLAMLSHELRTPLTPALLRLSALAGDGALSERAREDVKLILDNVKLEVRLIDDLLDLSRILRGKFEPNLEHLDLREVITKSLQFCEPDIGARTVILTPKLFADPLPVYGDRVRLQQVFWNVLRNAVKFTPEGGRIVCDGDGSNGSIVVSVADSGIGIEPEAMARIFSVFEQGGNETTRRFGGLGLGLAISRAVLIAHQGTIEAYSAGRGEGSTFTISLPSDTAPPELETAAPPITQAAPPKKPLRILLVEDHNETRNAMARLLRKLGYELAAAPNATEAAEMAAQGHFDVVISDLGLPDRDGYDLMRELSGRHQLKGIALSGYGMEQDLARSKESGFAMHMVKPVTIEALAHAIDELSEHPAGADPARNPRHQGD
jgi:PAS domain S-box-containing protein